jgi:hypothetical protein
LRFFEWQFLTLVGILCMLMTERPRPDDEN